MEEKTLELLDFPKIRNILKSHCQSGMAQTIGDTWQPASDREEVVRLLAETRDAILLAQIGWPSLGGAKNIEESVTRAAKGGVLLPEECVAILQSLETYAHVEHYFSETEVAVENLRPYTDEIVCDHYLVDKLRLTFDERGNIRDQASAALARARRLQYKLQEQVKSELESIVRTGKYAKALQESIVTIRNDRYVLPIKAEYRAAFPGIVHARSATGQTLYIEPLVSVELNNELQEAVLAEKEEIKRILQEISAYIGEQATALLHNATLVAQLDFIFARAKASLSWRGICPQIPADFQVQMETVRHPLLPAEQVVPIDLELGGRFRVLAITGSNTGGKTVALKTMGLMVALHQSGLLIPAREDAKLPIFANIYAAIGDEQSLEANLSTFSGHMKRIISIMDTARSEDLVLLDELGSGTDPVEGAALAIAVLDYFCERHILTMVTTHYSELKRYVYAHEAMENAHVEFDEVTLSPTYRLHIGIAGNSRALSITRRLGMREDVLARADVIKQESPFYEMEKVIDELNGQRRALQKQEDQLQAELQKAERAHRKWDAENRTLQQKKLEILQQAREDARQLKRELRVEAEQIIKELKKQSKLGLEMAQKAAEQSRQAIDGLEIPEGDIRKKIPLRKLHVGQEVFIDTLERTGIITALRGKQVQVDVQGFPATVGAVHCYYPLAQEVQAKNAKATVRPRQKEVRPVYRDVGQSVNVIGCTIAEAIPEVEKFLDAAVMAGLPSVEIIHGKGTGTLRKAIHELLQKLPYVESFDLADAIRGGSGATIVKLQ